MQPRAARRKLPSPPPEPSYYSCAFCGAQFPSLQALGGHKSVHRPKRKDQTPTSPSTKRQKHFSQETVPKLLPPTSIASLESACDWLGFPTSWDYPPFLEAPQAIPAFTTSPYYTVGLPSFNYHTTPTYPFGLRSQFTSASTNAPLSSPRSADVAWCPSPELMRQCSSASSLNADMRLNAALGRAVQLSPSGRTAASSELRAFDTAAAAAEMGHNECEGVLNSPELARRFFQEAATKLQRLGSNASNASKRVDAAALKANAARVLGHGHMDSGASLLSRVSAPSSREPNCGQMMSAAGHIGCAETFDNTPGLVSSSEKVPTLDDLNLDVSPPVEEDAENSVSIGGPAEPEDDFCIDLTLRL